MNNTFTLDMTELHTATLLGEAIVDDAERRVSMQRKLSEGIVTKEAAAKAAEKAAARLDEAKETAMTTLRTTIDQFQATNPAHDLMYSTGEMQYRHGLDDTDEIRYYLSYNQALENLNEQLKAHLVKLDAQRREALESAQCALNDVRDMRVKLDMIVVTDEDRALAATLIEKWETEEQAKAEAEAQRTREATEQAGVMYKKVCSAINQMSKGAQPKSDLWIWLYEQTGSVLEDLDWQAKEKLAAGYLAHLHGQDADEMLMAVREAKAQFRASKRPRRDPVEDAPEPDAKTDGGAGEFDESMFYHGDITWNCKRNDTIHNLLDTYQQQYQLRTDIIVTRCKADKLGNAKYIVLRFGVSHENHRISVWDGEKLDSAELEALIRLQAAS